MQERIGVIGAGVMGRGIAQVLAVAGHEVACQDVDAAVLDGAVQDVETGRFGLQSAVERGLLTPDDARAARQRVTFTSDIATLADADVIIEAVPERLDLKIRVFRDLDGLCRPETILASNSSGLPVAALAAATDRAPLVIGWHWASPAPVMKLAEIVRGPETADWTVETVYRLAQNAGKNPIVVRDAPMAWGYVTNRVYFAMVREARQLVSEGIATRETIDQLMVDAFRWPSGPFAMTAGAATGWN